MDRALALLTHHLKVDFAAARAFYAKIQPRSMPASELNTVCEQLLFVLNQIAALQALTSASNKTDVARTAIVAWYYGIYSAASAMTAAMDGSFQDNHTQTARKWQERFPAKNLVIDPFADYLSNLVASTVKVELQPMRARGKHSLVNKPTTVSEAWGCCTEYVSGTAGWEQWNVAEQVRETRAFKDLKVSDFRTKAAQQMRDSAYAKHGIAFLHQASRYRGKANYRDAIFLAYGSSVPPLLANFIDDLLIVLKAFAAIAGAFCSMRVGKVSWLEFVDDLERRKAISVSPNDVWQ